MASNLDRFKQDLSRLSLEGVRLDLAIRLECFPKETTAQMKEAFTEKADAVIKSLPSFRSTYQRWYSEALAVIGQILPDRASDFIGYYAYSKTRKNLDYENYRIQDFLNGLGATRTAGGRSEKVVGTDAAIPHFQQQLALLKAAEARFESSLFDIRQIVQGDIFDSELDAAEHLAKAKYMRAAGALAGVVLERHLATVCDNHPAVTIAKKNATIAYFNDALKAGNVIDQAQWRFIQHLADLRNLSDHARTPDPTTEQIMDLLAGVKKVTKTIY